MNEAIAKHLVACDDCAAEIGKHYPEGHKNISVALLSAPADNGGTYKETHHFCNEACLASFLVKKHGSAKAAIASFSAIAKHLTQCDNCKASLKNEGDDKKQHIQATLANGKDESQQYHYCDEECLRQHLNARAKRKRERSNASLGTGAYYADGAICLDISEAAYISTKERNNLGEEHFLDPKRESFPIRPGHECTDLNAALHRIGTYTGSMSHEELHSKILSRMKTHGCPLPKADK